MPQIFVKPKPGLKVPFSPHHERARSTNPYLVEGGELVDPDTWWDRRLSEGDVEITDAAPAVVKNALSAPAPAGKAEKGGAA